MTLRALPRPSRTDFHQPVYCLLGIAFDQVSLDAAVQRLSAAAVSRVRLVLSTPNVNHIVAIQRDSAFRDSVTRCDLVVPDGMPLVWMARLLGIRTCRVAGSDIFEALRQGRGEPLRVYFFGGPEGQAVAASDRLNAEGGPLSGAGGRYPGFGSVVQMGASEVVAEINASAPDFVVVALGAAKGQQWIELVGPTIVAPLLSHLGAVVNFVAGSVRRGPHAVQGLGIEWLWRIKEEPALWRRYTNDGWALGGLVARSIVPLVARRAWRAVVPVKSSPRFDLAATVRGARRLTLSGNWRPDDIPRLADMLARLTENEGAIEIDAAALGWVELRFIGLLVRLYGHQRKRGLDFAIVESSAAFERQLRWHCACYLLEADKGDQ